MCGIVGYVGNKTAVDILLEGLTSLEYRGYDSSGIAVNVEGKVELYKENVTTQKVGTNKNGTHVIRDPGYI